VFPFILLSNLEYVCWEQNFLFVYNIHSVARFAALLTDARGAPPLPSASYVIVRNSSPLIATLSQINPVHALPSCVFQIKVKLTLEQAMKA
jgi:hypothetical protein